MKASLRRVSALLILTPGLFAQFGSGIQGTIVDNSGAVIPNVQVVVTNLSTGVTREVLTSDEGIFRVLSLGAGTYSVKATKEGFAHAAQPSVDVAANEIRKVDIEMKVSGVTETVNVSAQSGALETEQGRISSQITGTQLKNLPIPNRNIVNLMVLQPGVSGRNMGNEMLGSDATPQFNANGSRADGNSFTLDDSSINSISRGGRAEVTPNVETVAEVRVTTNNFSAEQGRNMGAQISIVTKSGTNQFHGSVWNYHTNNVLQARNIFDTTSGVPVNRRNQFGYGVGGPIIRNKTFFYTTYEGVRRSGATTATATVETPQLRAWVLENRPNSLAAYFMRTFHPVADPTSAIRDVGGPQPGVNLFSSTPDGIPDIGTVQYLTSTDSRSNQYTIRVDHELRPGKDRLYGYFYRLNASTITPGIRPDFLRPAPTWGLFGNLVYSKTISASALNEVRLSATRFNGHYCAPKDPANPVGGGLSCPDMLNKQVPGINITGLGTVRDVNVFPGGFFPTEYQLKDTFTMIRGSHALKIGGEIRRAINILWHTASYVPVYSFANILDFIDDEPMQMMRTVDPRTGTPTTTRADMLIWEGAGFIQDDWKVRRNLTLNIGLRYDYFGPYTDTHDRFRNFVPGTGSYVDQLASGKVGSHCPRVGSRRVELRAAVRIRVGHRRERKERDPGRLWALLRSHGHGADRDVPHQSAAGRDRDTGAELRDHVHVRVRRSGPAVLRLSDRSRPEARAGFAQRHRGRAGGDRRDRSGVQQPLRPELVPGRAAGLAGAVGGGSQLDRLGGPPPGEHFERQSLQRRHAGQPVRRLQPQFFEHQHGAHNVELDLSRRNVCGAPRLLPGHDFSGKLYLRKGADGR